jgi:hypothetical protein
LQVWKNDDKQHNCSLLFWCVVYNWNLIYIFSQLLFYLKINMKI